MEVEQSDIVDDAQPNTVVKRRQRRRLTRNVAEEEQLLMAEYFSRNDNGIKCTIQDCTSILSRWTLFHLKRHLEQKHNSIYARIFVAETNKRHQSKVDAFKMIQNAIALVSIDGFPFTLLEKHAFRCLIEPGLNMLRSTGHTVTINRTTIVQQLASTSDKIRDMIKTELKGRLFSLMFDITTKSTLSVLGVNASFIRNDVVVCRSLGVVQICERHTGENVAMLVRQILDGSNVSIRQIFAITTDNGSNMVKTTRMLNEMLNESDEQVEDDDADELSEKDEMET